MAAIISFDAPLAEFAKEIGVKIGTATRMVSVDLMRRIVLRTPVATGRARSGWDLTVGAPSNFLPAEMAAPKRAKRKANPDRVFKDVFGGGRKAAGPSAAGSIDGTQVVFIVNNLPYIEPLENGHSKQCPPGGMVRLSMDEVEAEIEIRYEKILAAK